MTITAINMEATLKGFESKSFVTDNVLISGEKLTEMELSESPYTLDFNLEI